MTRDQITAAIKRRLGFWTGNDSEIATELQEAQIRLEQGIVLPKGGIFLPWFLVSEVASAAMVSGEERSPLPTDFLSELEEGALWLYDANAPTDTQFKPLAKDDLDFLKADQPGTGSPVAYSQSGTYFRLKPTPDSSAAANKSLKLLYRAKDAILSTGVSENNWTKYAHELMVGEAGTMIAQSLRDPTAAKIFGDTVVVERHRLYMATESRLHENRRYIIGGED
jgi:hypothetical protein